jgi:hypothetical protein
MKNYKLVETEKGTLILSYITLNKLKTIPNTFKGKKEDFVNDWFGKLSFDKRLKVLLKKIKKKEPYVFELVNNNQIEGVRIVNIREGFRFELVYKDSVKIKIDEILYELCENKLPEAFLNY